MPTKDAYIHAVHSRSARLALDKDGFSDNDTTVLQLSRLCSESSINNKYFQQFSHRTHWSKEDRQHYAEYLYSVRECGVEPEVFLQIVGEEVCSS